MHRFHRHLREVDANLTDPVKGAFAATNKTLVRQQVVGSSLAGMGTDRGCPHAMSQSQPAAAGKLAETDALDAAVLAHFAEAVRPSVRHLRDAETQDLNSLVTRRRQLMNMMVSEKNRLKAATTVAARPRIEAHITWLERELDDLDENLRRTLR